MPSVALRSTLETPGLLHPGALGLGDARHASGSNGKPSPPISRFSNIGGPAQIAIGRKTLRTPKKPPPSVLARVLLRGGGVFLIRSSRRRVGPWLEKSQKRNLPGLCLAEGDPFDGERLKRVARELKRAGGGLGAPSMPKPNVSRECSQGWERSARPLVSWSLSSKL